MKILKKSLLVIVIIQMVMFIPTMVSATNIYEESMKDVDIILNSTTRLDEPDAVARAFVQTPFEFKGSWRTQLITITRTTGASGVTIATTNFGTELVDVCLFKHGVAEAISYTESIYAGELATISWTNSDIRTTDRTIDVFFTMYKTANNNLTGTISY